VSRVTVNYARTMSSPAKIEVIIPLASRRVAKDWPQMCRMLQGTLTSVLALPREFVIVSIFGHERPENLPLGDRCRWTTVDWNPPQQEDIPAKLNDKGSKLWQGVREAFKRGSKWVMFLDADDLVSNRLPGLCDLENHDAICFENGFSWETGSRWLQRVPNFHRVCGSSWIMRLEPSFFPMWLGPGTHRVCDLAHNERHAALVKDRARIQSIHDPVAVYCVGHLTATGFGEALGRKFGTSLLHPRALAKQILRRKRLTANLKNEFAIPVTV
jgi:hypothetical protein